MNRRRQAPNLDLAAWAEIDASALRDDQRKNFLARRQALELYAANATLAAIEASTGVDRQQLYRLLDRCLQAHPDGRLFGWRAALPYCRVADYQRVRKVQVSDTGGSRGTAGAFASLLQSYPGLSVWIDAQLRAKRITLRQVSTDGRLRLHLGNLKPVHLDFLRQCRAVGLTTADYPFSTEYMGIRSLAATLRRRCLDRFDRSARLAGATHLKGMPGKNSAPAALQALDVVEFDGHRLDVRLKIVVRDPMGFEQQFEIERIWLLVIIDVFSRAVLGYHVSLNREYTRYDVIRTIEAAIEPHRRRDFTLPGVGYGAVGGFPSGMLPDLGYAVWRWIKLDNAKANLAEDVRHALTQFIGCNIDAGPAHTPDDRPYVERFFGSIASSLSSRLPGYTGSNARDMRRALADPKGDLRLCVSLAEIEELLEAAIAAYNASPHDGLNGRTPLEAIEHSLRNRGAMLTWLPEAKRRTLCLMQTPKRATVRGCLHQGQRPHINFHGVRYTNATLASTAAFLGQSLRVYYHSGDLRTVRAFAPDGAEIGVLKAQGAWGEIAHDLKLHQEVLRLRGRKRLAHALSQEFLQEFIERKVAQAKRTRRAASDLAQTVKTLAAAPTSVSAQPPQASPRALEIDAASAPAQKVEPQRLRIPSGFVGPV